MSVIAISGANEVEVAPDQTVEAIRLANAETLNIDPGAEVRLNGQVVGDDYVVKENDTIEFIMPSGVKG